MLEDKAFLHIVIRDLSLGDSSTLKRVNLYGLEPMAEKQFKVRLPANSNYSVIFFMKGRGVAIVDDLYLQEGDGTTTLLAVAQATGATTQTFALPKDPEEFLIERPSPPKALTLSAAEFGASPTAANNPSAFTKAIEACRNRGASHLLIPPGRYLFDSMQDSLVFTKLSHLTIDGQGSELIFFRPRLRNGGPFIQINSCDHLVFKNLKVDWDWSRMPLASVVQVKEVDPDGHWFDCRFTETARFHPSNLQPRVLEALDPATLRVGYEGAIDLFEGFEETLEWKGENLVRLRPKTHAEGGVKAGVRVGNYYRMRHFNYDMGGFYIDSSTQLTLSNVTIYSCPGMAIRVDGDSHHIELNRVRILPKPGEARSITCTADHFHVNNSQGYLKLESCDFGFGGDDCLNIHDNNFYAVRLDSNRLLGKFFRPWATPLHVGDLLELRNEDLSPTGFYSPIKSFLPNVESKTVELTLTRELPANTPPLVVIYNRRYGSHHYIIRNSLFHENRAAGFRLQADNGIVESNYFFHNQQPAIRLESGWAESLWSEGTGVSNLIIRNNTFDSCNTILAEEHGPVIHSGVFRRSVASPESKSPWPVFSSILIESNTFLNTTGAAITLSSAGAITIRSNFFCGEKSRKVEPHFRSSLVLSFASNVQILDNVWQRSPYVKIPGVVLEPENTGLVRFDGNRLQ